MNTQLGNSPAGNYGAPQYPQSGAPQSPQPRPQVAPPMGGGVRPHPVRDPEQEQRRKTITWIIIVAIVDFLLLLMLLFLPSRCAHDRNSSEMSDVSDISEVMDNDDSELQFGIEWSRSDRVDMDAHCTEPSGNEIFWDAPRSSSGGRLNIDNRENDRGRVEHITWPKIASMPSGKYRFAVQNFTGGTNHGVKAKLQAGDQVFTYRISNLSRFRQQVPVVTITVSGGQITDIEHHIQPE